MFLLGLDKQLLAVLRRCGGSEKKNISLFLSSENGLFVLCLTGLADSLPLISKNFQLTECPSSVMQVTLKPHLSNLIIAS